jgi:hypothetical protein
MRRLTAVGELLGIGTVNRQGIPSTHADDIQTTPSLLELRMMRVFREVRNPDTRRILIELAEQIVKRQHASPEAGQRTTIPDVDRTDRAARSTEPLR